MMTFDEWQTREKEYGFTFPYRSQPGFLKSYDSGNRFTREAEYQSAKQEKKHKETCLKNKKKRQARKRRK